ncbi:DoxX family membrane protein [Candidatus Falkowbacteria bacterium]|nr:DoxX family membrane protein [Candidatus Falkowbacteria bacterium]
MFRDISVLRQPSFVLLRVALGILFGYAGISHLTTSGWSAGGYLMNAKTFSGFYAWLAGSSILPLVNFVNEWGLTLLGISLALGLFVRFSAPLGALLMLLYYFPVLNFPLVGEHGWLVDEHIVYLFALLYLAAENAGTVYGLDKFVRWRK